MGFHRSKIEKENIIFRRSLYFVRDVKKGHKITQKDIRRIRPGYGISPKYFNSILGKKLIKDVQRGDAVRWELFNEEKFLRTNQLKVLIKVLEIVTNLFFNIFNFD